MRIRWLGHACFVITSDAGLKVIIDPYNTGGGLNYGEISESADIVLSSHEHGDHNNTTAVKGRPHVIKEAGVKEVKGIKYKGIATYHDESKGTMRGANTVFAFEIDDLQVCHLGDLGHDISEVGQKEIGKVDILFIPVGGFYTIDAQVANQVCIRLAPKVIIPMHYKTSKVDTASFGAIVGVDAFLKGKPGVDWRNSSEVEIKAGELPVSTQILVLKSAL